MRFVLELNKKEKEAIDKAGNEVKNVFKKIRNTFQIKIVEDKNGGKKKK